MAKYYTLILGLSLTIFTSVHCQTFWEKCGEFPIINKTTMTLESFVINSDNVMLGYRTAKNKSYGFGTLFRSTDLGKNWKNITNSLPDLVPNPQNNSYLKATNVMKNNIHAITAVNNTFILIHGVRDNINIIRSTDAGGHWKTLPKDGIHEQLALTSDVNVCSDYTPSRLFAAPIYFNEQGNNQTLSQSDDFGMSWKTTTTDKGHINEQGQFNRLSDETTWFNPEGWANKKATHPQVVYTSDILNIVGNTSILYGLIAPKEKTFSSRLTARNLYTELVQSSDDGKSWQVVKMTGKAVKELRFVDCQGNLYAHLVQPRPKQSGDIFSRLSQSKPAKVPPIYLFRSTDNGQNWQQLTGMPDNGAAHSYQVGYDGRLYTFVNRDIFRSTESICCEGGSAISEETECELTMADFPKLSPVTQSITSPLKGKIYTGIRIHKGDYVCVVAKGKMTRNSPVQGIDYIYPNGVPELKGDTKKYNQFNVGQLIIHQGNEVYGCTEFTFKGDDCKNIDNDELFMQLQFVHGLKKLNNEYGDYFIAKNDGIIEFETNYADYTRQNYTTGQFNIEIYILTKRQHQYRNCFNHCPTKEPINLETQWSNGEIAFGLIDDDIEECYHGGDEDYRGTSTYKGSQCVYDKTTHEFNNNTKKHVLGTFDYGYSSGTKNLRLHFILDVFPHIIYLQKDEDDKFKYHPTPQVNMH